MSKAYEVLRIDELTRVSDTHGIEKYYRCQIKSAGGTVLSVNIDEADFTPEKTAGVLTAAAANADAIRKG